MIRLLLLILCFSPSFLVSAGKRVSFNKKPYVMSTIHAQLGNQLFEVAAALSLAIDNDAEAYFPDFETKTTDNIPKNKEIFFSSLNTQKPKKKCSYTYEEADFSYNPIPYKPNMKIHGYFQSEKYFKHNKDQILPLFEPKAEIIEYLKSRYIDILEHPNTVAIHIRTYFDNDPNHHYYHLNGRSYVKNAMRHFPKDSLFVVFSDKIDWTKQELKGLAKNMRFIEKEAYYHDFYLMSLCKHQIISNSTFSWWAAYLNKNSNKIVVAPKKWFGPRLIHNTKDLYPEGWILESN